MYTHSFDTVTESYRNARRRIDEEKTGAAISSLSSVKQLKIQGQTFGQGEKIKGVRFFLIARLYAFVLKSNILLQIFSKYRIGLNTTPGLYFPFWVFG